MIGDWEPRRALRPNLLHNASGPVAETAAQHFALVRALQAGVDVDGDGAPDLDGARIYMLGQSFGGQVAIDDGRVRAGGARRGVRRAGAARSAYSALLVAGRARPRSAPSSSRRARRR